METLKHFTEKELKCKGSGIYRLSPAVETYPGFGSRIDRLREIWGKPLIVNSCCRSEEYNKLINGHPHSLHVADHPYWKTNGTCAIDFRETSKDFRDLAYKMGFSLGLGKTFTHVDDRTNVIGMAQTKFHYAD